MTFGILFLLIAVAMFCAQGTSYRNQRLMRRDLATLRKTLTHKQRMK